ncbi:hypothetical protein OAO42_00500 [Candidatus Izimaplasma bacterium]|nr:hypothetical protein [Candidatus Izimaplasma bacterium]
MKYDDNTSKEFFMYSRNRVSLIVYNQIFKYIKGTFKHYKGDSYNFKKNNDKKINESKSHIKTRL